MNDSLDLLYADGIVDEILARLKSGKEADVWIVLHQGEEVAAKIYKDRAVRSFKNNSGYTEGRKTKNSRTARAMGRGSKFGREAAEQAWKETEANALFKLHAAGVRVPTPHLFYEGVLLMDLVRGADGGPAPRLIDLRPSREEAARLYEAIRAESIKMLCADMIHGDLSPYNVLVDEEGPVVIDFPQMVDAAANNRASFYYQRDLENIRQFLSSFDRSLQSKRGDGKAIWKAYEKRELSPDFVPPNAPTPAPQQVAAPRGRGGPVVVHVSRLPGGGAPSPQAPARGPAAEQEPAAQRPAPRRRRSRRPRSAGTRQ